MTDHAIPHYHNTKGYAAIRIKAREFMCIGALPPFDHPHIFIDLGGVLNSADERVCPYCSTLYIYDGSLQAPSQPNDCLVGDEILA